MTFTFSHLSCTREPPSLAPPQTPVTALDIDRNGACFDMSLHMADMCPACNGNTMQVGDYVCWGFCYRCYKEATR